MTKLQQVQVRMSEVRQRLNELGGADKPTDEQVTELTNLSTEYRNLEVRFRALVQGSAADGDKQGGDKQGGADQGGDGGDKQGGADEGGDGSDKELRALTKRVELRAYLAAAMDGRDVAGAEAEFNTALGIAATGGVQVPWEAIAPTEDRARGTGRVVEERVDAATVPGQAMATENMAPILGRVFQRSVAAWLGVRMPAVAVGERNYPVMTGGTTAGFQAAGSAVDASAATYVVTVIAPTRLTARYVFRVEDLATVAGLEASLREDLRMTMSDQLDAQILTGDGTAPNLAGLFDDDGLAAPADPSSVATVGDYLDLALEQVDGINAYSTGDVRLLIGTKTHEHAGKLFITGTDTTALDKLRMMSGGVRVSARVPAVAANKQELLAVRMNGFAVAPMWPSVSLVRDIYSGANKGEVALTAIALYGFKVVRANGYARLKVQLPA